MCWKKQADIEGRHLDTGDSVDSMVPRQPYFFGYAKIPAGSLNHSTEYLHPAGEPVTFTYIVHIRHSVYPR